MDTPPSVAIIGRPNVGKSTFFNKMAGHRISIVEDTPGVTRDRIYADCRWQNYDFTLIDTGGIDPYSQDPLLTQMRLQAQLAIETCESILFFVDGKEGLTGADFEVADMLRRANKPVLLVVNKIDSVEHDIDATEFYALAMGEAYIISSVNMLGLGDLLEALCETFPKTDPEEINLEDDTIKIAVIGRPNVGKSSLVNRILNEERVMVSDIPGTTRDAIDSRFEDGGDRFMIIDTAGIRRRARVETATLERYSVIRAFASVRRADVVLMLIDAEDGVTEQDAKIAGYADEEGKAIVLLVNKWDALEKETGTLEKFTKKIRAELKFLSYAPILYISAKTGQRVDKVLDAVRQVHQNASRRITTGVLNETLSEAMIVTPPPSDRGRRLRIFYATQAQSNPPTFVLFVNNAKLMHYSYERYLENHFRKTFELSGTPIKLIIRERGKKGE